MNNFANQTSKAQSFATVMVSKRLLKKTRFGIFMGPLNKMSKTSIIASLHFFVASPFKWLLMELASFIHSQPPSFFHSQTSINPFADDE